MRRTVICALIMAVMIITGIFLDIHTIRITSELSEGLKALEASADVLSPEEMRERAEKLSEKWESFCADNIFLTNNEGAFEISKSFVRIISCSVSDRQEFAEECHTAAQLVELYNDSRSITPGNIF